MTTQAQVSPFRSPDPNVRLKGAKAMILECNLYIELLQDQLAKTRVRRVTANFKLRLKGEANSRASWEEYIAQGCPKVPGAVAYPGWDR